MTSVMLGRKLVTEISFSKVFQVCLLKFLGMIAHTFLIEKVEFRYWFGSPSKK